MLAPRQRVLTLAFFTPPQWVTSKEQLGLASSTKRPTSCVMVAQQGMKRKQKAGEEKKDDSKVQEAEKEFQESYEEVKKEVEALVRGALFPILSCVPRCPCPDLARSRLVRRRSPSRRTERRRARAPRRSVSVCVRVLNVVGAATGFEAVRGCAAARPRRLTLPSSLSLASPCCTSTPSRLLAIGHPCAHPVLQLYRRPARGRAGDAMRSRRSLSVDATPMFFPVYPAPVAESSFGESGGTQSMCRQSESGPGGSDAGRNGQAASSRDAKRCGESQLARACAGSVRLQLARLGQA